MTSSGDGPTGPVSTITVSSTKSLSERPVSIFIRSLNSEAKLVPFHFHDSDYRRAVLLLLRQTFVCRCQSRCHAGQRNCSATTLSSGDANITVEVCYDPAYNPLEPLRRRR